MDINDERVTDYLNSQYYHNILNIVACKTNYVIEREIEYRMHIVDHIISVLFQFH